MQNITSLKTLPSDIQSIFWIRHSSFQETCPTFFDLNLLLDGVVENVYRDIEKNGDTEKWLQNFYFTGKNYAQDLHLFFINVSQCRLKTELENIRSILKSKLDKNNPNTILLIDESDSFKEEYFSLKDFQINFVRYTS